ncbi:hypothetical protein J3458_001278 [Metarhizium acridum]|uniref:uncharacterized protein n=1 Tax=Metarhizium acridum TaxID=92637 RepID=UPI001C6BE529|nr:hypothetical protein J3458_001278 [Metarhizium acridum]
MSSATISKITSFWCSGIGFFEMFSTSWLSFQPKRSFIFAGAWKLAYNRLTPELSMTIVRPFALKWSKSSCKVTSPISNRSQILSRVTLPSGPLYTTLGLAIGSLKPKNGRARLMNPFLYCSISFFPVNNLVQLHGYQTSYKCSRRGNGRDNLPSNEFGFVSISRLDLVVFGAKVAAGCDEVDVVIGVVILFKFNRLQLET